MKQRLKRVVSFIFYITGVTALVFRAVFSRKNQVLILLYHQIKMPGNSYEAAVSGENFERHMQFIAKKFKVVSLGDALEIMRRGEIADKPLAVITFDDGFRNNFKTAFPILTKYSVPATFFITSGSMDNHEPLWTAKVEYYFKQTSLNCLVLETLPMSCAFDLADTSKRFRACQTVKTAMKKVSDDRRRLILEEIENMIGLGSAAGHELSSEMLSWDEVRKMTADPLVSIGSHSESHRMLANTPNNVMMDELTHSKIKIEAEIGKRVRFFSYPGNSYNNQVQQCVLEAGYEAACAVDQEICVWNGDLFKLKRVHIEDGGLDYFLAQITLLMNRVRKRTNLYDRG